MDPGDDMVRIILSMSIGHPLEKSRMISVAASKGSPLQWIRRITGSLPSDCEWQEVEELYGFD